MSRFIPRGVGHRRPHLSYSGVVATLALFFTLAGGSAYAASKLITGSQIAKGTITSRNIKSGSLTKADFAKKQLPSGARGVTGAQGPQGPQGPQGATGATGATGAAGTAVAYGAVIVNGSGNPVLQPGAVGFTSSPSTPGSTGLYCLQAPSNADANLPPMITALGTQAIVFNVISPSGCPNPSHDIAIQGYDPTSGSAVAAGSSAGFSIALP